MYFDYSQKLTLKNLSKSIKKWLFEWLCKFCSQWIKVTILCGCFLSAKFKDVFFSNEHLTECKRSHDGKYNHSHLTISDVKRNDLFDMINKRWSKKRRVHKTLFWFGILHIAMHMFEKEK